MSRPLVLGAIASCALFGGYAGMYTGFQNGLFDAIGKGLQHPDPSMRYIPGGPAPFKHSYTGVKALDDQLCVLIGFFSIIINGEQDWGVTVGYWSLMIQFAAAWMIFVMEGLRKGNAGKAVAWVGTWGLAFQNFSWTIVVPLYFMVHLVTSPVAKVSTSDENKKQGVVSAFAVETVSADPAKLKLIPICTALSFVIPAVVMSLPSPSVVSPDIHYTVLAIWQVFPILHSVLLLVLGLVVSTSTQTAASVKPYTAAAASIYQLVLALCTIAQLPVLFLSMAPASILPAFSSVEFPFALFPRPSSLIYPPTAHVTTMTPMPDAFAPLSHHFLQWDVFCGNMAMLFWALYLHRQARKDMGLVDAVGIAVTWWSLGGPIAAVAALLWERDEALMERNDKKDQ